MQIKQLTAAVLPILLLAGAALTAGCSNDLVEGLADAAPVAEPDAAIVAPHVVYLVFDGLTVTNGSTDDPAANVSGILNSPFIAPPLFADLTVVDERLALIADGARSILAPYNIEVVTERPATGDYDMIVFGGDAADANYPAEAPFVSPFKCNEDKQNIGFIFEKYGPLTKRYASNLVTTLGVMSNIPTTTLQGDCMCRSIECLLEDSLCEIGGPGTPVNPEGWPCEDITEVDLHAQFLAEFGAAN